MLTANKADRKRFRRFARGGSYGLKVRHVLRFRELGWIGSRLENPVPGYVTTTWFITDAGQKALEGKP